MNIFSEDAVMEATVEMNHSVSHAARKIKEGADELQSAVIKTSSDAMEQCCKETDAYIRSNPYSALLIAFAAGAFAAITLRR